LVEKVESAKAKRELAYAGLSSASMDSIPLGWKRLAVLHQSDIYRVLQKAEDLKEGYQ
jgi:hypothetical protein